MTFSGRLEGILFSVGPIEVSASVVMTWALIFLISAFLLIALRGLQTKPTLIQTALEGVYLSIFNAVHDIIGVHTDKVLPFISCLWTFILIANLMGLIPGLSAPTSDLSVTAALAFLVFCSVHWFGVQIEGWRSYLKHYITPSPILMPFHLISELSRTIALAVRLFGNVMSLEIAAILVLMVAGLLVPIPLLILHIVEAIIQAYLFGILTLIYIAGALQSQEHRRDKKGETS